MRFILAFILGGVLNGCVTIYNNNYPNQKTPQMYMPDFHEEVLDLDKEKELY